MPEGNDLQKELLKARGKLNALSAVLRLGHESFEKKNLIQWASHVVNNSVLAVPYSRSALLDFRGLTPKLLAVSNQPEVNSNSEYAINLMYLSRVLAQLSRAVVIDREFLQSRNADQLACDALDYFLETAKAIMAIPIVPPDSPENNKELLVWVIEFENKRSAAAASALLPLLCRHYAESLQYALSSRRKSVLHSLSGRRAFKPSRIIAALLLIFLICLFVVRVRENIATDAEIIPEVEHIYYAPFDGVIESCLGNKSGMFVRKGMPILKYDDRELTFKLLAVRNEYNKTKAKLDLIQNESFSDVSKRGQVKLLTLQKKGAEIAIARNHWQLQRSEMKAETSGVLNIGDADKLAGRAVHAGEKLFEIVSTENLIALVYLNESNAAIMTPDSTVTLYLHNRPETPIKCGLKRISPKPVLTEKKVFCYLIRLKMLDPPRDLICGQRGIARISGPRIRLGYYLFRNLVLWWRRV
ncbi:MAG: HlyD family efflux transporter periplasmic adaptor subunit [Victivallaceae bacterium]|nr:HlyD family efflux transporter periplasmic adaptor subunit [Victivallaceae bacterium]